MTSTKLLAANIEEWFEMRVARVARFSQSDKLCQLIVGASDKKRPLRMWAVAVQRVDDLGDCDEDVKRWAPMVGTQPPFADFVGDVFRTIRARPLKRIVTDGENPLFGMGIVMYAFSGTKKQFLLNGVTGLLTPREAEDRDLDSTEVRSVEIVLYVDKLYTSTADIPTPSSASNNRCMSCAIL